MCQRRNWTGGKTALLPRGHRPRSPKGPPPKKLQFVPAGGSTVKLEDIDWNIEGDSGPLQLEDITEEEEED